MFSAAYNSIWLHWRWYVRRQNPPDKTRPKYIKEEKEHWIIAIILIGAESGCSLTAATHTHTHTLMPGKTRTEVSATYNHIIAFRIHFCVQRPTNKPNVKSIFRLCFAIECTRECVSNWWMPHRKSTKRHYTLFRAGKQTNSTAILW